MSDRFDELSKFIRIHEPGCAEIFEIFREKAAAYSVDITPSQCADQCTEMASCFPEGTEIIKVPDIGAVCVDSSRIVICDAGVPVVSIQLRHVHNEDDELVQAFRVKLLEIDSENFRDFCFDAVVDCPAGRSVASFTLDVFEYGVALRKQNLIHECCLLSDEIENSDELMVKRLGLSDLCPIAMNVEDEVQQISDGVDLNSMLMPGFVPAGMVVDEPHREPCVPEVGNTYADAPPEIVPAELDAAFSLSSEGVEEEDGPEILF